MDGIKVIIQSQEEYNQERLRNFETQKMFFKFLGKFIIRAILAGIIALMFGTVLKSYQIGFYLFAIFIILYLVDLLSRNRKIISYLRAVFGGTYMLIAVLFILALFYFIIKGADIKEALFGSFIAIGLFGYMGYHNLNKYTNLFRKKHEYKKHHK